MELRGHWLLAPGSPPTTPPNPAKDSLFPEPHSMRKGNTIHQVYRKDFLTENKKVSTKGFTWPSSQPISYTNHTRTVLGLGSITLWEMRQEMDS